jgi:hypothetical protein
MGLKTLLYVSKSLIAPADIGREIENIVSGARTRNAERGVSGVLIFTEARFAQVIEGPEPAIDALMDTISIDPRHKQVTVVREGALDERRYADWSMAYSGPSLYVDRHVRPLLDPVLQNRDRRRLCDRLLYLMEELARVTA